MTSGEQVHDPELETSVAAVATGLASGAIHLIDVRERDEWDAGHVAGAILIPMSEFANRVQEIEPNQAIVTMCHVGGRSLYVAEALTAAGYPNVRSMAGGMQAWIAAGQPVEY